MIHHSVILKLKYPKGSEEETRFIAACRELAKIPGVHNFKVLEQVSSKNQFDYGLSMNFNNQEEYDTYSAHPDHEAFIQNFWIKYVTDFLEIDYLEI